MSRVFPLLCALGFLAPLRAAESLEALLRAASEAGRTNISTALAFCDNAVREFPTNAAPLAMRAKVLDRARRYDDAVADMTAALKLKPDSWNLFQERGEMNFKAGHFKESVADFDREIELSPDRAPHHWQRGISLYYAKRFSDGRRQFESHREVNPNDVENATWHFLCVAREFGVTNARAAMLPVGPDARVPMKQIDALYRGTGSVEDVLSAARAQAGRDAMFYANLYLGLYFEALGQMTKAREHITLAANDPTSMHYMGDVARVHLRTLGP
jgi:lipoprotein NlpI